MKRRKFIKQAILGSLALGVYTGVYSWQIEPYWLEFVEHKLPIKNLPEELNGKILMQISDMHVGNRFDYHFVIESFKKAKLYNPDFVVYTGDFVTYDNEEQFKQLDEVLEHLVRGKLGTVGILGNHDWGDNWSYPDVADRITRQLDRSGMVMLRNDQEEINGLNFIGFDDLLGLNFHPGRVMSDLNHHKANLVLCHNPDGCDLDVWNNYKGWILSGHTHGGQVKPPFFSPPVLPVANHRYTSGEFDLWDGRMLYINRALGNSIPVRFNVRPEITIFKLSSAG